jgi:hypothetical protein
LARALRQIIHHGPVAGRLKRREGDKHMEDNRKGGGRYFVTKASLGRWQVVRRGIDKSVASFPDRQDALECARRLSDSVRLHQLRSRVLH